MGGTNEKVLSQPAASAAKTGKSLNIGTESVRILRTPVRFIYDDKNGMKVAIHVAEFMKVFGAWKDSPVNPLVLIDHAAKTQAIFALKAEKGETDIDIQISKVTFGKNFQALVDFAEGK